MTDVGNDGGGIHSVLSDIGSDYIGVHDIVLNSRSDYIYILCKFLLEPERLAASFTQMTDRPLKT
jgi:hypothetical protein